MTDLIIRHYIPETDLSALARMLTEIEAIDHDGEDTSEEYLRSMKAWTNFDPDQNIWLAELDGNIVGYGQIVPKSDRHCIIYVAVHPTQRRKGLGSELLALVLARASQTESKTILVYANEKNTASTAFLARHGFYVAGTSGVMVAPVNNLPYHEPPAGYVIRRYSELGDPEVVVQALNDCYRAMVGHHQNVTSADRFIKYYGEDGIHLLFNENETLIGVCAAKPEGKTDERGVSDLLDAPGLIKEYRQRGFQRFFTLAVMRWLREKGTHPITLEYWGDNENTLEIYLALGFELTSQQITYQKELG